MALYAAAETSAPLDGADKAILQQLTEVQQELTALRIEMGQLRQAVTELHQDRLTALPEAETTLPKAIAELSLNEHDPMLGSPEAKVALIEFSDFECPFCARYHNQTFPKLKQDYVDTGKLRYVYRHFPLEFHEHAKGAAIAANCAGKQNAYWEMSDGLFANQRQLGPEVYANLAKSLKLDEQIFAECLNDPEQGKALQASIADSESLGVQGTPHFFIGRIKAGQVVATERISGAQDTTVFAQVIERLLQ